MKARSWEKIAKCKKGAGLTQEQTADLLNIKQQAYARYESGVIELDYQNYSVM
ncbi:MAG: helix-turn-helix domain-containing protein [Christensenellaceae bacterium]